MRRIFPNIFVLSLLLLFAFQGCYSTKEISIQVLHPPERIIFNTKQNLALINHMFRDQYLTDTLKFHDLKIPVKMYHTFTWKSLYGFADVASESPWVDRILFDSVFIDTLPCFVGPQALKIYRRDTILARDGAIVGIDLTELEFSDSIYSAEKYFFGEAGEAGDWYTVVYVDLFVHSHWFLYVYQDPMPKDSVVLNDTLFLKGTGRTYREAVADLPDIRKSIEDMSYQTGQHNAYRIFPVWNEVTRIYYKNNLYKKMKQANKLAMENHWMEAAAIWKGLTYSSNKQLAAKAAFNMALASEINDKLDLAESWLIMSMKLYPNPVTGNYLNIVRERLKDYRMMNLRYSH